MISLFFLFFLLSALNSLLVAQIAAGLFYRESLGSRCLIFVLVLFSALNVFYAGGLFLGFSSKASLILNVVFLILAVFCGYRQSWMHLRWLSPRAVLVMAKDRESMIAILVIAAVSALIFFSTLYIPYITNDSLRMHLPKLLFTLNNDGQFWNIIGDYRWSLSKHGYQALLAYGYVLTGGQLGAIMWSQMLIAWVGLPLVLNLHLKYVSSVGRAARASLIALFLMTPVVYFLIVSPQYNLHVGFGLISFCAGVLRLMRTRAANWFMVTAGASLTLATSEMGIFVAFFAALFFLYELVKPIWTKSKFPIALVLVSGLFISIVGGWAYLYSLVVYGSPIYPNPFPISFAKTIINDQHLLNLPYLYINDKISFLAGFLKGNEHIFKALIMWGDLAPKEYSFRFSYGLLLPALVLILILAAIMRNNRVGNNAVNLCRLVLLYACIYAFLVGFLGKMDVHIDVVFTTSRYFNWLPVIFICATAYFMGRYLSKPAALASCALLVGGAMFMLKYQYPRSIDPYNSFQELIAAGADVNEHWERYLVRRLRIDETDFDEMLRRIQSSETEGVSVLDCGKSNAFLMTTLLADQTKIKHLTFTRFVGSGRYHQKSIYPHDKQSGLVFMNKLVRLIAANETDEARETDYYALLKKYAVELGVSNGELEAHIRDRFGDNIWLGFISDKKFGETYFTGILNSFFEYKISHDMNWILLTCKPDFVPQNTPLFSSMGDLESNGRQFYFYGKVH